MRSIRILLILILCLCTLCIPVLAANSASLSGNASVGTDGSSQISVTIHLHLDSADDQLQFPIPKDAQDVHLNGVAVRTQSGNGVTLVPLGVLSAGDYSFQINYRLTGLVTEEKDGLLLTLPLLSGFGYPITSMEFTVTLPTDVPQRPLFSSGYHQENIETGLVCTVSGNTISGAFRQSLKDHETLVMTLPVTREMFPQVNTFVPPVSLPELLCAVCIVLAVIYYAFSLLPQFPRHSRSFSPPEGISAGEVGTCLTGSGPDLTLMVITWAQLGYIQLEVDGKNRVLLHKRMEMGNERSNFEARCFQNLFGQRKTLDGTGTHYARMCRKVAAKSPLLPQLYRSTSGNPRIFRILACCAGAISGIQLGLSVTDHAVGRVLLAILMCGLCFCFSYFLQSAGKCIPLRDKSPLYTGILCAILWIALGALLGKLDSVIPMTLFQSLAGVAAAYGGQRSDLGKRCAAQIQGLRLHMIRANNFDLQQLMQSNPYYFYELAPYALALGVDRKFARRFGKIPLPDCSFLTFPGHGQLTPLQWVNQLRRTADLLNTRQKRLPYERLTGR